MPPSTPWPRADGTRIAVQRTGSGPPVILIGGAFNDRSTVVGLAAVLADSLTAVTYDRRGRGDDLAGRLRALLDAGDRDGAAELFLAEAAAMPPEMVDGMRIAGPDTSPPCARLHGKEHHRC